MQNINFDQSPQSDQDYRTEQVRGVLDQIAHWVHNPGTYDVWARPDVQSIFTLIGRAGEQLQQKQYALKTLKEYENHTKEQEKFLIVLTRSLDRLPRGVYAPFIAYQDIKVLEKDATIVKSWVDWYKRKRAKDEKYIRRVEDSIPTYPDFEITKIHGRIDYLRVSTNIPVFELRYRIRQAFEYFWVLYNVYCFPYPAPLGKKLPLGPRILNPDWCPRPRVESAYFLFDPELTIRTNCINITELFLISIIKYGYYPEILPLVIWRDEELSPTHPFNAVKEFGID